MIMTMISDPNFLKSRVEVIPSVQRRRLWSVAEKVRLVEETMQPSHSVSPVARRAGISPSQLFAWKRRMLEGGTVAVQADEDVVAAILQKGDEVRFPGGYLRALTEKKREGQFSVGPILMALIGTKLKAMRGGL